MRRPMTVPDRDVCLELWREPNGPWHFERRAIASGPYRGEPVMLDSGDASVHARGILGEIVKENGMPAIYLRVGTAGWLRLHWPIAAWVARRLAQLVESVEKLEAEATRS